MIDHISESRGPEADRLTLFRLLISPVSVMLAAWTLSLSVYFSIPSIDGDLSYFNYMVASEGLRQDYGSSAFIWLGIAFASFVLGTLILWALPKRPSRAISICEVSIGARRSLIFAFSLTSLVAMLWVGGAVIKAGSIGNLMALATSDNAVARDFVLSSAFPGGRLISSGFIGIAIFCSVVVTRLKPSDPNKKLFVLIFCVAMTYLALMPVLVSGRINFFVACIGSFVAASLASKRVVGLRYLVAGLAALIVVWIIKDYFRLGHVSQGANASSQGLQGLLFYFYNDTLNTLNTIGRFDNYHTYGWYSIRFLFYFTFTDGILLNTIADSRTHLENWVTAGEVPLLSAPLVDFGALGLLLLFGMGASCQYIWARSRTDISHMAVYGLVFAALLLSAHSCFITSQEVIYSALLITFLFRSSRIIGTR